MQIVGVRENSFVDFKGKIAYVIFTARCNLNCWYCHNRGVMNASEYLDSDTVLADIRRRVGFIDGVVISGGEATLQHDIVDFFAKIKAIGLKTKLDTNGTNPDVIAALVDNNLVDFVAMDIKTALDKYKEIVDCDCDLGAVKKSIKMLMDGSVDYEFRTTFAPDLGATEIIEIAKTIKGAKLYALQQFVAGSNMTRSTFMAHSPSFIKEVAKMTSQYVPTITRGL